MKKHLIIVCALLISVMAIGLFACSTSTTSPVTTSSAVTTTSPVATGTVVPTQSSETTSQSTAGQKQLVIGIATPLTGPSAFLGGQISDAVQMAIEDQNAKGGITIAGQNYKLVPMVRDTKADAATGQSIGQEMVSDGVKIIVGPFQADAVAMQPIIEANKVLTFFVQVLSPDMTGPNKPYSFFVSFPIPQETFKLLNYIKQTYPDAKTVYSMEADTPDAPGFIGATQAACQALGFTFLGSDKVPVTATDFTSDITRVMASKPDIIDTGNIGGVMGGLGAQLYKQLGQAGYTGVIMDPAAPPQGVVEQTVPSQYLSKVVTQYIAIDGSVVDPGYRDVMNEFNTKYNQQGTDLVSSYDNVMMALFQFLNTQSTMDSSAWMQGFADYKWQGIMGFESQWIQLQGDGIARRVLNNQWVTHYDANGKPVTDYAAPIPPNLFFDANGNPISQ